MAPPSIPLIFVRPLVEASQITFTWLPPTSDGGSPITGYILSCASPPFTRILQEYDRSTFVTDLTPGVSYTFSLVAVNSDGSSEPASFRTVVPGYRPGTTSNVQAYFLNNDTAIVSWSTTTELGFSPLINHVVRGDAYDSLDNLYNNSTILQTANSTASFVSITSLGPYKYRFYSIPVNSVGYGPLGSFSTLLNIPPPTYSSFITSSIMQFGSTLSGSYTRFTTPSSIFISSQLTVGTLSGSNNFPNYEFCVKSTTVVSTFVHSEWFSPSNLSLGVPSFCVVNGDLTINSGVVFKPDLRFKPFVTLFVKGNLVVNGEISMTGRGQGSSGYTTPLQIAYGTYSGVSNPLVPINGGAGGDGNLAGDNASVAGTNGSGGSTGGGGSGCRDTTTFPFPPFAKISPAGGSGAQGGMFGGGGGGGGAGVNNAFVGSSGGNANQTIGGIASQFNLSAGGAGEPPGTNPFSMSTIVQLEGARGVGGVLFVICTGSISGSGSITADGLQNSTILQPNIPGGSSGGGSVTVFYSTSYSLATLSANGGASQVGALYNGVIRQGGAGGNGTARALQIP